MQDNKIYFLVIFCKYSSIAIEIDGAVVVGAEILRVKPESFTAFEVVGPIAAMAILPCLKSGKLIIKNQYRQG